MNYNTETDSIDSIFNESSTIENIFGGSENEPVVSNTNNTNVNNTQISENNLSSLPVPPNLGTYKLPLEKEDIGLPVYLAGLIQLIVALIFISKKKIFLASLTFFTIFIWMFNVHCVYAGKAYTIGQYNATCRSFSYVLVMFPLICIMLVLYDDYRNVWNNLRFNSGSLSINMPKLYIEQTNNDTESDNNNDESCEYVDNHSDYNEKTHSHEHSESDNHTHHHTKKKVVKDKVVHKHATHKKGHVDHNHNDKVEGYENINTYRSDFENIN